MHKKKTRTEKTFFFSSFVIRIERDTKENSIGLAVAEIRKSHLVLVSRNRATTVSLDDLSKRHKHLALESRLPVSKSFFFSFISIEIRQLGQAR